MHILLIGRDSMSLALELTEFVSSCSLENEIEIHSENDHSKMYDLEIEISSENGKQHFYCPQLDYKKEESQECTIRSFLMTCCGYNETKLVGMSVKDSYNNKIKPEIPIYSRVSLNTILPNVLSFSKQVFTPSKQKPTTREVYFNSEILKSVLESNRIVFKDEETIFEFFKDKQSYFVRFEDLKLPEVLDHLLGKSVLEEFIKHAAAARKYSALEPFISGKIENLVLNKKIFAKIKKSSKDLEKLLEFVENAPKFQDERDDEMEKLKMFLYENMDPILVSKYRYLEVYKQKIPKNKSKYSLKRYFLN